MTLYLVRHGSTGLNSEKNERLRAWLDVPLNTLGHREIRRAAKNLDGSGIGTVVSSDLLRARQTAGAIGRRQKVPQEATPLLRPWNLGALSGRPVAEVSGALDHLAAHPDEAAPGGEPFASFRDRWASMLSALAARAREEGPIAVVVHARHMLTLPHLLSGGREPIEPKGGPRPGEIVRIEL